MIGPRIDCELRDHPKAEAAGFAMYLWLWGMLWLKAKMENGIIPEETILRSHWGTRAENAKALARLASSGLIAKRDDKWEWCNYLKKNESREETVSRLDAAAKRKREWDRKRREARRDGNALPDALLSPPDTRVSNASAPRRDETRRDETRREEGVQGEKPPPADSAAGDFGVGMRKWEAGVRSGLGRGFAPTCRGDKANGFIRQILSAHGPAGAPLDWLESEGAAFARLADPAKYPTEIFGFQRWLNDGKPDKSARRVNGKPEPTTTTYETYDPYAGIPTAEELERNHG